MKINPNLHGVFINGRQGFGYLLDFWRLTTELFGIQRPVYKLHLDKDHPLGFRQHDGTVLMPADGAPCDGGTVRPIAAQLWIAKDRFQLGFIVHDSIYSTGGLWVLRPGHLWQWVAVNRSEADALLRTMCRCDPVPCGWWKATIVWAGVRAGGWAGWRGNETWGGSNPNTWTERPDVDDPPPMGVG